MTASEKNGFRKFIHFSCRQSLPIKAKPDSTNLLIISGGDGYEDFRNSGAHPSNEVSGREDSTNHLLLWNV